MMDSVGVLLALGLVSSVWWALATLVWRPLALTRSFARQGVRGPPYRFFSGSLREMKAVNTAARRVVLDVHSHDIPPKVLPHYHTWSSQYGATFLYWLGVHPRICITDPEMVKQVLSKFTFYLKPNPRPSMLALLGKGLVLAEGLDWVRHRRVVSPAFTMDKLKVGYRFLIPGPIFTVVIMRELFSMFGPWICRNMLDQAPDREYSRTVFLFHAVRHLSSEILETTKNILEELTMTKKIAECTISMLDEWQDQVVHENGQCIEVEMNVQFQGLAGNVICHTAFGSSHAEGKEVFLAQKDLQLLAFSTAFDVPIPGGQYLPTRTNLQKWRLERRARGKLTDIIRRRLESNNSTYGDDLLGLMMDASRMDSDGSRGNLKLSMDEIIDECKTFFFAGHETTSHLLTWTMFFLSSNAQWQEKLREEVLRECGMEVPDAEMLSKLKLTTMVLLEALRLYCPVILMTRRATQDMKLGNLIIPKDTQISIPVIMIHRNKELWGADANDFNPSRFENGISKAAKHPNALLSFSVGPRSCVGQNFALLEAKLVMAMILQRFSFTLSSNYRHAPTSILTLQPQFGLPVLIRPLHM